jgi:hypothetical protein
MKLLECSRAYQLALAGSLQSVQFPHCLPNGNYDTLQCVNQACFCISSTNQTLTSSIQPITAITELPCCNFFHLQEILFAICTREFTYAHLYSEQITLTCIQLITTGLAK